jgi:hypothetical protein
MRHYMLLEQLLEMKSCICSCSGLGYDDVKICQWYLGSQLLETSSPHLLGQGSNVMPAEYAAYRSCCRGVLCEIQKAITEYGSGTLGL